MHLYTSANYCDQLSNSCYSCLDLKKIIYRFQYLSVGTDRSLKHTPQNQSAKEFSLAYYRALENMEISKESIKCGFLTVFGSVLQASY